MMSAHEVVALETGRYSHNDVKLENGINFTFHLNEKQSLRFLHKIFPKMSKSDVSTIQAQLGFTPPPDYFDFLMHYGGVSLFDNCLHIYGYEPILSRSISIHEQNPIHIGFMQKEFSELYADLHADGWRTVGSLALMEKHPIAVSSSGKCLIVGTHEPMRFTSFDECIATTVATLSQMVGCQQMSVALAQEVENSFFGPPK